MGVPVAIAATTVGKGGEVACARKLLQSDQVALENSTLIADSLHTNATNAHLIVSVRDADYSQRSKTTSQLCIKWPRNN
jgi:hypothetical protein